MKIMIHSNGPMVPSGYGRQTALAIRQLTGLGHDVAVSSFHGVTGEILDWYGVPVYPSGMAPFGIDVLLPHANHFGAELILTLMDTWKLMPILGHLSESLKLQGAPRLACWTPVDCAPLSQGDRIVLQNSGAVPVAMSRHGVAMMAEAGLKGLRYVPHSVDTAIYRPLPDAGQSLRLETGTDPAAFVIGIVAANRDMFRKAWPEQFEAFAQHLLLWPDSELWVHTIADGTRGAGGYNLKSMAAEMGIGHRVRFSDDYAQIAGLIDDQQMAIWYNAIDLLSACSYGEGFGLPIVEAQACGTPAVATKASAMTELATEVVSGSRWWNAVHNAWWVRPEPDAIDKVYAKYRTSVDERMTFPAHVYADDVAKYDVDAVAQTHWKPFLEALEAGE